MLRFRPAGFVAACLRLDQAERLTCAQLLEHDYLTSGGFVPQFEAELQRRLARDEQMATVVERGAPGGPPTGPAEGADGGGEAAPPEAERKQLEQLAPDAASEARKPEHRKAWARALRAHNAKMRLAGQLAAARRAEQEPAAGS